MRRKIDGYIFLFNSADHRGHHIHIYRNDEEIGVFDLIDGPIRGLEERLNGKLRDALAKFIDELNERGFFRR